jgi:hypothetical protein
MSASIKVAAQRMNRKLSEERDSQRASLLANEAVNLFHVGDKVVCGSPNTSSCSQLLMVS